MRIAVLLLAFCLTSNVSHAGVISGQERDGLVQRVLGQFWGNAKDSNGELIQPATQQERWTVPVESAVAYRALAAGELSGVAEWCGLEWQSHYLSLTRAARAQRYNDKQVAFISVLHGAAQGIVVNAMKGEPCGEKEKGRARAGLDESRKVGINGR